MIKRFIKFQEPLKKMKFTTCKIPIVFFSAQRDLPGLGSFGS